MYPFSVIWVLIEQFHVGREQSNSNLCQFDEVAFRRNAKYVNLLLMKTKNRQVTAENRNSLKRFKQKFIVKFI